MARFEPSKVLEVGKREFIVAFMIIMIAILMMITFIVKDRINKRKATLPNISEIVKQYNNEKEVLESQEWIEKKLAPFEEEMNLVRRLRVHSSQPEVINEAEEFFTKYPNRNKDSFERFKKNDFKYTGGMNIEGKVCAIEEVVYIFGSLRDGLNKSYQYIGLTKKEEQEIKSEFLTKVQLLKDNEEIFNKEIILKERIEPLYKEKIDIFFSKSMLFEYDIANKIPNCNKINIDYLEDKLNLYQKENDKESKNDLGQRKVVKSTNHDQYLILGMIFDIFNNINGKYSPYLNFEERQDFKIKVADWIDKIKENENLFSLEPKDSEEKSKLTQELFGEISIAQAELNFGMVDRMSPNSYLNKIDIIAIGAGYNLSLGPNN